LKEKISDTQVVIGKLSRIDEILSMINELQSDASELPGSVFQISPMDRSRILTECRVDAVSQWAFDYLVEQCVERQADAVARFYHQLSGKHQAASLLGHLIEIDVLTRLSNTTLQIRRLDHPFAMTTWTPRGRKKYFSNDSEATDAIAKAVQSGEPLHLIPRATNFTAVDSIVYDSNQVLTFIQVTINKRQHPISVSGLQRMQTWLKLDTPLAALRPHHSEGGIKWRLVFVVSADMVSTFKLQRFDGDTPTDNWAKKVVQYVAGWEMKGLATKAVRNESSMQDSD